MYIICIESSKARGMGHLFRALLYVDYLKQKGIPYIVLLNDDFKSIQILKKYGIAFEIVDFNNSSDWPTAFINKYHAAVWLQDKFETSENMARCIKKNKVIFCAIDDFGDGAAMCDIHFAGMLYLTGQEIRGSHRYFGSEYVILNPEINQYKRVRNEISDVIVSLGGSDPYGMTVAVVDALNETELNVTVLIGPAFDYLDDLRKVNKKNYPIRQNVPSLIQVFAQYDFAITGGGVTCCEANACGLPCMIIANAPHEKYTGAFMEKAGGAVYLGSYEDWNRDLIKGIQYLDVKKMSQTGMRLFNTEAVDRIFRIIEQERTE